MSIATRAFALSLVALFATILPSASASGDGNDACVTVLTTDNASGLLHPVFSLGDAIAVGATMNAGSGAFGAILLVEPALCHVPTPGSIIGSIAHSESGTPAGVPDLP